MSSNDYLDSEYFDHMSLRAKSVVCDEASRTFFVSDGGRSLPDEAIFIKHIMDILTLESALTAR